MDPRYGIKEGKVEREYVFEYDTYYDNDIIFTDIAAAISVNSCYLARIILKITF
jgi:hypothetical protein